MSQENVQFPGYRAEDTRRNIVASGIALNGLVGGRFRIGALRPLVHRGGLRADIITSCRIAVGDPVERIARL